MKKVLLTGLIAAVISMEGYAASKSGIRKKGEEYALHNQGTMIIGAGTMVSAADGRKMRLEPNTHTYVAGRVEWTDHANETKEDGAPYFTTDTGYGNPGTVHIQDQALALQKDDLPEETFGREFTTWYRPTGTGFVTPAIIAKSKGEHVIFANEPADLGSQVETVKKPETALVLLSVPEERKEQTVMNLTGFDVTKLEVNFAIGNIPLPSSQRTGGVGQSSHRHGRPGYGAALDAGITDDGGTLHSLVITKKVRLNGNQEFFRAPGTAVLVRDSGKLIIGSDNALFQTPIGIADGSTLKIGDRHKKVSVNTTQKITIGGKGKEPTQSKLIIGEGSTLELTGDAVLELLGDGHDELTIESLLSGDK